MYMDRYHNRYKYILFHSLRHYRRCNKLNEECWSPFQAGKSSFFFMLLSSELKNRSDEEERERRGLVSS